MLRRLLVCVLCCLGVGLSQAAEFPVGLAAALTGPASQYGVSVRKGVELATEEINAKGGVKGASIKLLPQDTRGRKEEAINVFRRFIVADKVVAIVGPTLSNSAFAADPLANQMKTPVLGTSNTASGLTDIGPFVFRNSIMEADVLPVTLAAAVGKFGVKKVAVVYGNDDAFTKSGYDVFKKALADQGIAVTATETFAKGDVDFRAQLTKIKATNPDSVVVSALAEEAANILLQMRQLGMKQPVIGGNGFNSPKLFQIAGQAADNTVMGGPWASEADTVANKAFVAAYKKKYGVEPDQFAAQAYDAMYLLAAGLASIDPTASLPSQRLALAGALPKVMRDGATGSFRFRQARAGAGYDAQQKPHVFVAKGGSFTLLK